MAFEDVPVIRKLNNSTQAILLNSEKARESLIEHYGVSKYFNPLPIGQWFNYLKFIINENESR